MWDRPPALRRRRGRSRHAGAHRGRARWAIGLLLLAACGDDDHGLAEKAVVGVYDTTVVHVDGAVYEGVARVDREDDGTLEVSLALGLNEEIFTDESLDLDLGPLAAGMRTVRGFFNIGDLGEDVEGSAVLRTEHDDVVWDLEVSHPERPVVVTLRRPRTGTPREFTARYRVRFETSLSRCSCPSTAEIVLDVPGSGIGARIDAVDVDDQGSTVGLLDDWALLLSPSGRVRLGGAYRDANRQILGFDALEGDLGPTLAGGEGVGRAILGGITPALDIGGWTAVRVE
jgi:hypothetical protein